VQNNLDQVFSALADPTRRAIISQLSSGEANVSELARPFLRDMSLPAITKHLKVLEQAGLITKTRDAQWRQCSLNKAGFKEAADWMEEFRIFWEDSFDRLDDHLKTMMAQKERNVAKPVKSAKQTKTAKPKETSKRKQQSKTLARGKRNVGKK
jgi:DNA-binding transcriptional ArsR family regulator